MPPQRRLPEHSHRGDLEANPLSGGTTVLMSDCLGRYLHVKPTHHEWSTSHRLYNPNHWYNRTATPEPPMPQKSPQLLLYQQKQAEADARRTQTQGPYHNTTNNGYGHHTRDNKTIYDPMLLSEARHQMLEGRNYEVTRKRLGLVRCEDDSDLSSTSAPSQHPSSGSQTTRINYNSTQLRRFGTTPTNTEWYSTYSQAYALNTLPNEGRSQSGPTHTRTWHGEYDPHRSAAGGLGYGRRHRYHRTYLASV